MPRIGSFDPNLEPQTWPTTYKVPVGWFSNDLINPPASGTPSQLHIKISGVWKVATPYIKISGVWKQATPFIKISGTWK